MKATGKISSEKMQWARMMQNPIQFARLLTIIDKRGQRVRLKANRSQREFLSSVRLGERVTHIVVKPRQIGMTTIIHALNLCIAMTHRDARIMTLFDKSEHTAPARQVVDRMYLSLPEEVVFSDCTSVCRPSVVTDNATTRRFENGATWSLATAGGKSTGRSRTLDVFHGSEVAHWTDPEAIASGALQAAEFAIFRVLESTANGAGDWFHNLALRALDGDKTLRLHFSPWWWTEEYAVPLPEEGIEPYSDDEQRLMGEHALSPQQIAWRREKQRALGSLFFQEYPEDVHTAFLTSGHGYFGDVDAAFSAPMPAERSATHYYVAGIDWGQQDDYTAVIVIDATSRSMVDMLRTRHASWAEMRREVRAILKRWDCTVALAESNAMGSSQIEQLRWELYEEGARCAVQSFAMTASSKPPLMQTLRMALNEGTLSLQNIPILKSELSAARAVQRAEGWTVESPRDGTGHGDTVVALALAWRAAGFVA